MMVDRGPWSERQDYVLARANSLRR